MQYYLLTYLLQRLARSRDGDVMKMQWWPTGSCEQI